MTKTYVITGATSGIGQSLVEYFINDGNKVYAGYRNAEKIDSIPAEAIPFYIDSTKEDTIIAAAEFIKSKESEIDTLINVSGCVVAGAIEHIEAKDLRRQFEVNVFAHLILSQKLLNILEGGKIINISSMSSFGIFPFISPYGASKRALDILFQALENETKHDIKVISIKPGVIATPLWEKSIKENEASFESQKEFQNEMKYMINNAQKNGKQGLQVEKVVKLIAKVDKLKNPNPSYTIGFDAKFAEIASHLPLKLLNNIIKYKIKKLGK